jgi:hypothetical protein
MRIQMTGWPWLWKSSKTENGFKTAGDIHSFAELMPATMHCLIDHPRDDFDT